jgi:hypothetical protein
MKLTVLPEIEHTVTELPSTVIEAGRPELALALTE